MKYSYHTEIGNHYASLFHMGCILGVHLTIDGKSVDTVEHNLSRFGKLSVDYPNPYECDDEEHCVNGIEACNNARFTTNDLDLTDWVWQHFLQEYSFTEDELIALHQWVTRTMDELASSFGYCDACIV